MAPDSTIKHENLLYIIVEDIADVARRLQHEMQAYPAWAFAGHAQSVRDAKKLIDAHQPALVFCDWDLVGGSGFEVLQYLQQVPGYRPFVVFNTGFQSDHPEIAEELINTYKPDAFINKPYWQKLLEQLPGLLQKAEQKQKKDSDKEVVWIKTTSGEQHRIEALHITAIVQCGQNPRNKLIYLSGRDQPLATTITWQYAAQMMQDCGQEVFAINRRFALVSKRHVQRYQPPYLWVGNPQLKLEVVKENTKDFERWLQG